MAVFSREPRFRGLPISKKDHKRISEHQLNNNMQYYSNRFPNLKTGDTQLQNIMPEGKLNR